MKNSCVIKSNKTGLKLILDEETGFEDLVREICQKFADSRSFFGHARLILAVEGRVLSPKELAVVIEAIELNSDIKIRLIVENDELKEAAMVEKADKFFFDKVDENAKIVRGSVKRGEKVESDSSLIILGDVREGAEVSAVGNIIVMGEAAGFLAAGLPNNEKAFIVANSFDSENISIAGVSGDITVQRRWSFRIRRRENMPQAVILWEGELLQEPYESGILNKVE